MADKKEKKKIMAERKTCANPGCEKIYSKT